MSSHPLSWWQSQIGPVAPVGYALRRYLNTRWTRFHSLPEAKRYADSAAENQDLLKRHNQVADAIFTTGEIIYVYQSRYPVSRMQLNAKHAVAGRQLRGATMRLRVKPDSGAPDGKDEGQDQYQYQDDDYLITRALVTTWKPDFFDVLVHQVAAELESMIAIASPQSHKIYCPYDGGMDIFVANSSVAELEGRFPNWQSSRPDKL